MIGHLTYEQCEFILHSHHVGRLGFCHTRQPYVLPITYVYENKSIYARSLEGMKIKTMRKNIKVCFQVDDIASLNAWRSVLALARYEELTDAHAQKQAQKLFAERLGPLVLGTTVDPFREPSNSPATIQKKIKPVLYRILVDEVSGRFEKPF